MTVVIVISFSKINLKHQQPIIYVSGQHFAIFAMFFYKLVELVGGGFVIDGAYPTQFYGRSRQCGRPVGAQLSMGLGRNPLINGLILHTFKINILFVEKFTVILYD